MSLAEEYRRQLQWRDWGAMFRVLPALRGRTVIDLGCGVGDVAALLAGRGAKVVAVDGNEELLAAARDRNAANVELVHADLGALPELPRAHGLWCSFVAAYFVDLGPVLAHWTRTLEPGGWAAFVEVDDLFGHEPLPPEIRTVFDDYADDALVHGRYDFNKGGKLRDELERAGFAIERELTLVDRELAFDGPALPPVVAAWRTRLDRLAQLRTRCGDDFEHVRDAFLATLARADHKSRARVVGVLARAPGP
ncbi:MAG TPA: class I SAM-dependent methyltransferase [Nannocystaceae bacterium]|nr:class I SAM-dependent methyltransferase [Nannocystaceae bacterium]